MAEKHILNDPVKPITCHAWNGDRTMVAVAPNNNDVHILSFDGKSFKKVAELCEHESRVTGVDWAPNSNSIVTCSEDRNAYVWKVDAAGKWTPTLVILRINRAATCVKWSPNEDKFAVGSGSRLVSICYFEEENDWWVSKHLKKPIRSTVNCIDWHPNNVLVAAGSTDFKARVFSGYVKGVDPKPDATPWGKKMKFGECMAEYGTGKGGGGWIHGVSFDITGNKLCFVGHDSSITVVDKLAGTEVRVATTHLPFRCVSWITESSILAAGHDNKPYVFTFDGAAVNEIGTIDKPVKKDTSKRLSAMDKFRQLDSKGTADAAATGTDLVTVHQNAIAEISIFAGDKTAASTVCSVGMDGKLVLWDIAKIAAAIPLAIK